MLVLTSRWDSGSLLLTYRPLSGSASMLRTTVVSESRRSPNATDPGYRLYTHIDRGPLPGYTCDEVKMLETLITNRPLC